MWQWLTPWAALAALLAASGCASTRAEESSLAYYAQSVGGHLAMVRSARSVDDWLADRATPNALRERLRLAQQLRRFAVSDLGLPDNASYQRYADLGRPAAVWNMVATPELSLKLKTWCFPLLGCVGYRGYFDRADADRLADSLRAQGLEVSVYGAPAYSTLGWTNWMGGDPLLNTFVRGPENGLARLLFHELAHQVAYASDDTLFNESYATAVERLGLARWLARSGRPADDPLAAQRRTQFKALTLATRQALATLYASDLPDAAKRGRKAELLAQMRAEHAAWTAAKDGPWAGFTGYDDWVANANNATLALQAAYDALVPAFERLFEQQGSDFARLHAEVKRLAGLPKAERHATLQALAPDVVLPP